MQALKECIVVMGSSVEYMGFGPADERWLVARIHTRPCLTRIDYRWILKRVSTSRVRTDIKQGHSSLLSLGLILICNAICTLAVRALHVRVHQGHV